MAGPLSAACTFPMIERAANTPLPNRKRQRLQAYDYAQPGMYFVTICSDGKRPLFGSMRDLEIVPSSIGQSVIDNWHALPKRFSHIDLDAFVLMPNHLHGLVLLKARGPSLSVVIATFKNLVTREARLHGSSPPSAIWQRGFYDRIVRNDADLARIQEYIAANPARWEFDSDNPVNWVDGQPVRAGQGRPLQSVSNS